MKIIPYPMIWLSQTAPSNVTNNKPVYAMPQTIAAQMAAPNRAAHVFNPFLNDVMLLAPVHSLNRAASDHIVASLSRALYSSIARASLNAADQRALLGLDYVVGHSRSSIKVCEHYKGSIISCQYRFVICL